MKKIKLFFDVVDYIMFRLFLLGMVILAVVAIFSQHWPWNR